MYGQYVVSGQIFYPTDHSIDRMTRPAGSASGRGLTLTSRSIVAGGAWLLASGSCHLPTSAKGLQMGG
jgi:hypothetical protein